MSKKLLALLLALVMIVGSFTSVLAEPAKEPVKEDKKTEEKAEEKKDEKSEEKKDEKSEEKKEEKTEEKTEEKKEEVKDEALVRAIEVLKKAGFISGYSKDSEDFKAEKNVTRAEFASMIVRVKGLEDSAKALATVPTGFKDVPTNLWANGYIAVAKQQGFINGYPNGTFQPNRQISYQDMATMLTIALGKAEVGTVYPAGYIVKAQQLGLFNNVKPLAYTDMATRGDVFKMVYNMITSKEFAQRKVLKAIVLENDRVENLGERQITVEVIDVVQKADWANASRDKKGDQHTYTLDKDLMLDPEQLLGRVVNVTVDKDDKIVELTEDKSYDYLEGCIDSLNNRKLVLDDVAYSVGFDERYNERDERIFRTYLDNKEYSYLDFVAKYANDGYSFARITVKNGKVIFIDAYRFNDIAPVTQVKDGAVYYRDDMKQAREYKAADLKDRVIFRDKAGYTVADKKEIVKDDVIHFYNNYKNAIVRKDAKVDTELVKTYIDRRGEWAVGKDGEYYLLNADYFRAIYSIEAKYYDVVGNRGYLDPIIKDKVKILVDIFGNAQLIESAKEWKDGINVVKRIRSNGEAQLLPPRGDMFWATETRDTEYINYNIFESTNNSRLLKFDQDDIVYYSGNDKQEIGRMGIIAKADDYMRRFQSVTKLTPRYIRAGLKDYRYFDGLNAYYIDNGHVEQVRDIAKFVENNKDNKNLEAFVISEAALKDKFHKDRLNVKYYNFLSAADDIANVVVFNKVADGTKYEHIYAKVLATDNYLTGALFVDAQGKKYDVALADNKVGDFTINDIVYLHIDKATMEKEGTQLKGYVTVPAIINKSTSIDKLEKIRDNNTYLLTKYDAAGRVISSDRVFFDSKTQEFGQPLSDYAQVYLDPKDPRYVKVVNYRKDIKGNKVATLDAQSTFDELVLGGVKYLADERTMYFNGTTFLDFGRRGFAKVVPFIGSEVEFTLKDGFVRTLTITKTGTNLSDEAIDKTVADAVSVINRITPNPVQVPMTLPSGVNAQQYVENLVKKAIADAELNTKVNVTFTPTAAAAPALANVVANVESKAKKSDNTKATGTSNKIEYKQSTAQDIANQVVAAIEELKPNYPIADTHSLVGGKVVELQDGVVDETDVLAAVKQRLVAALRDGTLQQKYPEIASMKEIEKITVAGVTDKDAAKKLHNVTFNYDSTAGTNPVVFEFTK